MRTARAHTQNLRTATGRHTHACGLIRGFAQAENSVLAAPWPVSSAPAPPAAGSALFAPILVVAPARGQKGRHGDATLRLSAAPPASLPWAPVPEAQCLAFQYFEQQCRRMLFEHVACHGGVPHCRMVQAWEVLSAFPFACFLNFSRGYGTCPSQGVTFRGWGTTL